MRILANDEVASGVTLYLTPAEARELVGALEQVIADPVRHHHEHVPDETYQQEITVTVYVPENLDQYDARSRRLILDGE